MEKEYLKEIAKIVDSKLPDNHKFILISAPIGDDPGRVLSYISNMERESVLNVLKEWLIKCGAEEDWMKQII